MKAYTDLEQSKRLAEILPIESADMFCLVVGDTPRVHVLTEPLNNYSHWENYPCWSLAALLDVLPRIEDLKPVLDLEINYVQYPSDIDLSATADNLVDACVEMILKLHEQNLL